MSEYDMDPDDMSDKAWHKTYIYSNSLATTGPTHSIKIEGDRLIFKQGNFASSALKRLIKPTMKGFWVPIRIDHGACLRLNGPAFNELIGLRDCSAHVGGKLIIGSSRLRSFELIPVTSIFALDIGGCENLRDLEGMPSVLSELTINYEQLKLNLKTVFYACSAACTINLPSLSDKLLENVINQGLRRKGGSMTERQALLQLQTDLIDHDLDEYSNI